MSAPTIAPTMMFVRIKLREPPRCNSMTAGGEEAVGGYKVPHGGIYAEHCTLYLGGSGVDHAEDREGGVERSWGRARRLYT